MTVINKKTNRIRKVTHSDLDPFSKLKFEIDDDYNLVFLGTKTKNMLDDLNEFEHIFQIFLNGEEIAYFD